MGAALVSIAAYSTNFALQLALARRHFGGRMRDFVLIGRDDVAWALSLVPALPALRRA